MAGKDPPRRCAAPIGTGSECKFYDDLLLFLNAELAAALGVTPGSGYELMHEADFPILRVGSRIVVPKEKFIQWVEERTVGSGRK